MIVQESHKRSPPGVSPHYCRLHGLVHHDASRGLLEIHDAVAGRQRHLQDADGCEGAGVLSVFGYSGQPVRGQVRGWKKFGQPMLVPVSWELKCTIKIQIELSLKILK